MANVNSVKAAVANGSAQKLVPTERLEQLIDRLDVKARLEQVLGKRASVFAASVLSLVKATPQLQACQPMTVIGAAMVAATLDLPVNKQLGFAYIVPYKDEAQFQMGYKGFIQLAMRTGQYKTIHATEVYEDEIKLWDPLHGDLELTDSKTWKQRNAGETDKIVGFTAYFELLNGFQKTLYMTKQQVLGHARRYSQSYGSKFGVWVKNELEMSIKTPLKLLLSKYGVLSIEMQKAIEADQGTTAEVDPEKQIFDYKDAVDAEAAPVIAESEPAEDNTDPFVPGEK